MHWSSSADGDKGRGRERNVLPGSMLTSSGSDIDAKQEGAYTDQVVTSPKVHGLARTDPSSQPNRIQSVSWK